jgi:hypothetical protein
MNLDDFALGIGTSGNPDFGDFAGAEGGAKDVAAWLTSRSGLLPTNVEVRIAGKATRENIDGAFGRLLERLSQGQTHVGRRLYIYMAGQGYYGPDSEYLALLTADVSRETIVSIAPRSYADHFAPPGHSKKSCSLSTVLGWFPENL